MRFAAIQEILRRAKCQLGNGRQKREGHSPVGAAQTAHGAEADEHHYDARWVPLRRLVCPETLGTDNVPDRVRDRDRGRNECFLGRSRRVRRRE